MKTLSQFYPFIEPEVMGCPYPVIDHQLRLALREFCQRSMAWREWVDAFTADGSTNTFDYDLASGQELVKVARALRGTCALEVMSEDQLPKDWQDDNPCELKDAIVNFDRTSFMVFPMPTDGDVFRLEMVFQPSLAATQVGDVLYATYADEIAMGCKARLMKMAGQAWSNAGRGAEYEANFNAEIRRAANANFVMRDQTAKRSKPVQGLGRWLGGFR